MQIVGRFLESNIWIFPTFNCICSKMSKLRKLRHAEPNMTQTTYKGTGPMWVELIKCFDREDRSVTQIQKGCHGGCPDLHCGYWRQASTSLMTSRAVTQRTFPFMCYKKRNQRWPASRPRPYSVNTLRPRQNGRHLPDDIFKCYFLNENVWISIKISLNFEGVQLLIIQHWFR